jgi:hypothetical protein
MTSAKIDRAYCKYMGLEMENLHNRAPQVFDRDAMIERHAKNLYFWHKAFSSETNRFNKERFKCAYNQVEYDVYNNLPFELRPDIRRKFKRLKRLDAAVF